MLGRIVTVAAIAAGGVLLSRKLRAAPDGSGASTIEVSAVVNVPVQTAYNQWTQFEDFPLFMDNVIEVRQLDDEHLHWRAKVGGKEKEWDAEITEQLPDQVIAWRSTSGARNEGKVSFKKLGDRKTRITVQMTYEPESLDEKVGDAVGVMQLEARRNLKKFKELIESRGVESGAWRGVVEH